MSDNDSASSSKSQEPQESPDAPVEELQREDTVGLEISDSAPVPTQPGEDILSSHIDEHSAQTLDQARAFLASPEIRGRNVAKKRKFLLEKGLSTQDIDSLLKELATPPPPVPPRSYPGAVRRASIFELLLTVSRACTYISGVSAIVLLAYFRFILPRLSHVLDARHEIQAQRVNELHRIQVQLEALRAVQNHHSAMNVAVDVDKIITEEKSEDITKAPPQSNDVPTESMKNEASLNLDRGLRCLASSLLAIREVRNGQRETRLETFESVSALTGYISSQIHVQPLAFRGGSKPWSRPAPLGPVEEEVRREIRALKGLALNRRSFVSASSYMPAPTPPVSATS